MVPQLFPRSFQQNRAARKKCCVHWRSVESHLWCYFPFRYFMWVSCHRFGSFIRSTKNLWVFVPGSRWTPPFCQKDWWNSLLDDDQLLLAPRNWWNLSPPTYYKDWWPEGLPGRMQLEKVIVIYHHPKGSITFFKMVETRSRGMRFNKHLLKAWFWGIFVCGSPDDGKGQSSEPSLRCLGFRSLDFCLLLKVYMYIP